MQTMKRKKSNILTLLTKTTFCFVFVFLFQSTAYAVKSFDNIFSLEEPKSEPKSQLIVNTLTEEDFGESEDVGNYEEPTFDGPYNVWSNTVVNPYNQNLQNTKDSIWINVKTYHAPLTNPSYITSHFGPRHYRYHYGTDLKLETGDTVRAAFDGMVRISKVGVGYGNYVLIRHNNGFETVYGHLSKLLVDTEQKVKAGDPIGLGGSTGHSTGPHLHFEVRYLGNPINPEDVIDFQGIYNLWEQNINLFSGDSRKNIEETIAFQDVKSPELEKIIGEKPAYKLREELELIDEVYPKFDRQEYLEGKLQPVFFGSASIADI